MKKMLEPGCPFCDADIEASTFAGSDHFRAAYDISPILPGHSLVIPRWHVESLLDLSEAELGELMVFGRDVVRQLLIAFHASAFDWTIQEGKEAGQTVAHLHLHLIPRMSQDLPHPGDWYPLLRDSLNIHAIDSELRPRLTPAEMEQIVKHLRQVWRDRS